MSLNFLSHLLINFRYYLLHIPLLMMNNKILHQLKVMIFIIVYFYNFYKKFVLMIYNLLTIF